MWDSTVTKEGKVSQCSHSAISASARAVCHGIHLFMKIGKLAAKNGKNWVGIMNISWKGVISLLQDSKGRETFTNLIDVSHILREIITCAFESVQRTAKAWLSLVVKGEEIKGAELKRLCIPIKFFLINAVRIASNYPQHVINAFSDIAACALETLTLRTIVRKHAQLFLGVEALVEVVEPSLFILLQTLLNSSEIPMDSRLDLLEQLIGKAHKFTFSDPKNVVKSFTEKLTAFVTSQADDTQLGRLVLLLELLNTCFTFESDMRLQLAKRLDVLLLLMSDARIYVELFQLHVKVTRDRDSVCRASWQLLYVSIMEALEVFGLSVAGIEAWGEFEDFLFRNILHPHAVCREMVLELWCFVARHGEAELLDGYMYGLISLYCDVAACPRVKCADTELQSTARVISAIVKYSPHSSTLQAYHFIFGEDPFSCPSRALAVYFLLKEHFPIDALPDDIKSSFISSTKLAFAKVAAQFTDCETHVNELQKILNLLPAMEILYCYLEVLIQRASEQNDQDEDLRRMIKMAVNILGLSKKSQFNAVLLSTCLKIISRSWTKMNENDINSALVFLSDLLKDGSCSSVEKIRPMLAETLAGVCEIQIQEAETNPAICALWELYHLVLKERQWCLAHLALSSFGYFAARTTCNELWRFVPPDATLAFDEATGSDPNEELFMACLRSFLEKQLILTGLPEALDAAMLMQHEGEVHQMGLEESTSTEIHCEFLVLTDQTRMDVDCDVYLDASESELLSGIEQALNMVQDGLSLLKEKLPPWLKESGHSLEQQNQIDGQLSLLADVIGQFDIIQCRPCHEAS